MTSSTGATHPGGGSQVVITRSVGERSGVQTDLGGLPAGRIRSPANIILAAISEIALKPGLAMG
ncbi:MAG: hypothetical protein ACLQHS_01540 [Candidatus Limnocylindrales bacterium]